MDVHGATEARLTSTPSKPKHADDKSGLTTDSDKPSDGMLQSPQQVPFAREIPPAISLKPRKVAGLFGRHERDYIKGIDKLKAPAVRERVCDAVSSSYDDPEEEKASKTMKLPASCFASPPRPSREQVASDRFTPQRNLGDLFTSPLRRSPSPPPADEVIVSPVARRVCKWQSPKRRPGTEKEASSLLESAETEESNPLSALLCPAGSKASNASRDEKTAAKETVATEETSHAVETTVSRKHEQAEDDTAPAEGDTPSVPKDEVPVCNEALRSVETSDICTLEVLVRHTRERVGVSALMSWTVAELKRRLVFLELFPDPGKITLKPRFEEGLLEDHEKLGTLDADITYEARAVSVA